MMMEKIGISGADSLYGTDGSDLIKGFDAAGWTAIPAAHDVLAVEDPDSVGGFFAEHPVDVIINTVSSADLDFGGLLQTLKLDGTMVNVGAPGEPISLGVFNLFTNRRRLAGSKIGGILEVAMILFVDSAPERAAVTQRGWCSRREFRSPSSRSTAPTRR